MYYNRICSSEGIYIAKSDNSGTFKIYRYWFFDHEFKVKDSVCDGSHVLTCCILIYSMLLLSLKVVDYHGIIHNISKSEAANLSKKPVLDDHGYM